MALSATKAKRAVPQGLNQADVACVAYELFLARGGAHGHDQEDWLRAEQIVRQRQRTNGR